MKKERPDSLSHRLTPGAAAALEGWLFGDSPLTYEQARSRLLAEHGVKTSAAALCGWRERRAQERMLDRIAASSRQANAVVDHFAKNSSDTFEALLRMIGQAAFDLRMGGENLDLGTLKDLAELTKLGLVERGEREKLRIKQEELALKERRVVLLERQAAQAEAAEGVVRDGSLTPEAKMARMREIFGLVG